MVYKCKCLRQDPPRFMDASVTLVSTILLMGQDHNGDEDGIKDSQAILSDYNLMYLNEYVTIHDVTVSTIYACSVFSYASNSTLYTRQ